ncbi:MAG: type VI secretion system tube protein Hcp [Planctomycetales bacterium]|nr:type VI secretion system tube protein Hcp [Planctomycetales bacterium]
MSTCTQYARHRRGSFESLESRKLLAADLGAADLSYEPPADDPQEMIYVPIKGMSDEGVPTEGYDQGKWFIADSFSFGVEREMKESGEKGGTEDINIGVGELQECTLSKSMDLAATDQALAETEPMCYLKYKLSRAFVKSWSTSGDADDRPTEEVAFYYNKIALQYASTPDGKEFEPPASS